MIAVELFVRFLVVSLLAFGGGQAALPLVERLAINDTGWVEPSTFGAAVAFSYLTPGPVLVAATFVGYRAAGLAGAFAATVGAFLAPWALATMAARQAARLADHPVLRAFGAGAAPAVVGMLGVTVLAMSREVFTAWPFLIIAVVAFVLAVWTRVHPVALLVGGGLAGWLTHNQVLAQALEVDLAPVGGRIGLEEPDDLGDRPEGVLTRHRGSAGPPVHRLHVLSVHVSQVAGHGAVPMRLRRS